MTENTINLPQWLARENGINRVVAVEEQVKTTRGAVVLKVKPVFDEGADACYRCGRELTHPVSRVVGYGPDCSEMLGLGRPDIEDAEEWLANARRILGDTTWEIMVPKSTLDRAGYNYIQDDTTEVVGDRTATLEGGVVRVSFPYDAELVAAVKALRNRRYDSSNKTWTIGLENGDALASFLIENGFSISPEINEALMSVEENTTPQKTIHFDGQYTVRFPYSFDTKEVVKAIKGAKYNGDRSDPAWIIPHNKMAVKGILSLLDQGFVLVGDAVDAVRAFDDENLYNLSSAIETGYKVDVDGLRPFQKVAVEYITKAKRVIVGDTMGLGKTFEALAAIEHNDLYPALIIVPAMLKLNWKKEVKQWLPHRSVEVLNGRQDADYDADIVIINYDILADGWQGTKKEEAQSKKYGRFNPSVHTQNLIQRNFRVVVMDEGHYVKEKGSQRSRATYYLAAGSPGGRAAGSLARRQGVEYRIWMTGTPILNRPSELIYPLEILERLDDLGGFNNFTYQYCDRQQTSWGMDISGASNLDELNRLMRESFMVRRTYADILDVLPEKIFADQFVQINNREEYNKAEKELIEYVGDRAVNDPEFMASLQDLGVDEQEMQQQIQRLQAQGKAEAAETLVLLSNLRRLTAEGKLQASIDWIDEFLKSGESLIVFANHRRVVDAISERFNAPKIYGGMNIKKIEEGKEKFQNGEEQLIVLNIAAGGVGHTLTAAHHIAFVEFPWNPGQMDQAIARAYARQNDLHGVTIWQLIAEKTMDESLLAMIAQKRAVVEEVTDGAEVLHRLGRM